MNYRIFGTIAVSVAAVLAAVSVTGCKSKDNGQHKEVAVPNVRTAAAQSIGSTRTVSYPGRIQPAKDVNLSFRVAGPVAAVHFREGQHVRQGDTLAEIEEGARLRHTAGRHHRPVRAGQGRGRQGHRALGPRQCHSERLRQGPLRSGADNRPLPRPPERPQ